MIRTVGILGPGALGTLLAYSIASRTSSEVWLFPRSSHPGEVTVEGQGWTSVNVASRPDRPVDLLLVLVKAYATADAIRWAAGAVGPQTVALTLQNGLGNAEALVEAIGGGRVLAGTTAQGATLLAPGKVAHGGEGPTSVGAWEPGGPAAATASEVAALFSKAGIPTEAVPDPRPQLWRKLVINCAINPVTALLRVPNGALLEQPAARRLMEAAAREAGAVAAAAGVDLDGDPVALAQAVAQRTAANRSSMLQDVERGRRTEIAAINGALAARGKALGVPTPVNETLADLVRALTGER